MAFSQVFTVLLLSVVCKATVVPVYLWGDIARISSKAYPLQTVAADEFTNILHKELAENPFTVVFYERTLSVDDFSSKNDGKTSFPYLQSNLGKSLYMPAVEDPLTALKSLTNPEEADYVKLTEDNLPGDIKTDLSKFLYIELADAKEGESRSDLLRRHNDFMQDMFTKLQSQYKNLIAVYTAENPSWMVTESHRVRRQAGNETEANPAMINVDSLLLYVQDMSINDGTKVTTLQGLTSSSTTLNETEGTQSTTLTFGDNSVVLNFHSSMGYWYLDSITVNQGGSSSIVYPTEEIYALSDFSYRCMPVVTFRSDSNDTKTMTFQDMKIQPFFSSNGTRSFGDSYNCVGFFSAGIWAGLFVVFIMLAIFFYGVMMMMDIRTMDRFDDPKGKTITINAAE